MATLQQRRAIGAANVAIGLIWMGVGSIDDDLSYAFIGFGYVLIGVAFLYFEGSNIE